MFKKNLWHNLIFRSPRANTRGVPGPLPCIFLLFIICLAGCQSLPTQPPVNLSQPGWIVRQGQVSWRSKKGAPEITGELLVATNSDGSAFVQFTKTPLPFLAAQSTTNTWQLHSIPDNKTYSGHGKPPLRAIWLWLPRCLANETPPKRLAWKKLDNDTWRLENLASGESLEGYLAP